MHIRRKSLIKTIVLWVLTIFLFLFGGYMYVNRCAVSWLNSTFQVIQWSEETNKLLLRPNNRRIYFHETSGRDHLTLRQTCAVESAAKENPHRPIQLIMQADISSIHPYGTWLNILSHYPNVAVILIKEADYFRNTPLEEWYRKGEWRLSPHKLEHFADYIRMLSNLKGGGLYMDLDFVTIKQLDVDNFLAVEDASVDHLSNGIFHFDYGHRLIDEIVKQLAAGYQPEEWNAHGPALIYSIMSKICKFKKGQPLSNECTDVALMPYHFVYPIHWPDWHVYFQKASRNIMQWINGSYAVHVWNKMSHSESLLINSDQVYSTLASRHCPRTVAGAEDFPTL